MPAPSRLLWRNEKGLSPELPTLGPQLGLDAQWIAVKMRITRHRRRRYQDAQSRLVTIGADTTIAVGSAIAHSLYVSLQPA